MTAPTLCNECDHVHPDTRKGAPRTWLCLQHPKLPGFDGFVTGEAWEKDAPYLRCKDVNGGLCKLWARKRDNQMELVK